MRESQYQIPTSAGLHEGGAAAPEFNNDAQAIVADFFARQDEAARAHEYATETHRHVAAVESLVDKYRNEALVAPVAENKTIGGRILGLLGVNEKNERPQIEELIERESLAGGQLFGGNALFWLHPVTPGVNGRDWYYSYTQNEQEYTVHYQSTETGFQKIYNGRTYGFDDNEMERLLSAISAYEKQVANHVYGRQSSFALAA